MYWWNVRKLAEDLREGRVDKRECWKYFLANLVPWSLFALLVIYSLGPFLPEATVVPVIFALAALYGMIIFWHAANKRGDNADFILRMICLAVPAGIQFVAIYAICFLSYGVIESLPAAALGLRSFVTRIPDNAWKASTEMFAGKGMVFVVVYFYFRIIYAHIAFAAKAQGAEDSPWLEQTNGTSVGLIFGLLSGLGILVTMAFTGVWVPGSDDRIPEWQLVGAVLLWAWLFSFVFSRLRQRPKKHA